MAGSYDHQSGAFRAPSSGVYRFTFSGIYASADRGIRQVGNFGSCMLDITPMMTVF